SGDIRSPNYPSNYPNNADCRYRINAGSSTRTITLTFSAFNLEGHSYCKYDFVDIRVGFKGNAATPVRKYCGSSTPAPITITGQQYVYIQFSTDGSVQRSGFRIQYTISGISQRAPGSTGLIKSPNYPSNYPKNTECKYRVNSGTSSNSIAFNFLAFNLEPNTQCRFDYLQVFNGPTTILGSIGKYCGSTNPSTITRTTSYMSMKFKTDGSVTRSGFNVRYSITGATLGLTGSAGYTSPFYSSPNHPNNNPHNLDCYYRINAQSSSNVIKVTFQPFNLEKHSRCNFDYVAIYEGAGNSSRLIGKFCGTNSSFSVKGRGQYMYMHYHTDSSVPSTGFRFKFSVSGGPGSGDIRSPNYPSNYPNNADCRYRINAGSSTRTITLTFSAFNLESHSYCKYDFVDIRVGFQGNAATPIRKYCGSSTPAPITITGQQYVYIQFSTDGSVQRSGFRIRYTISGIPNNFTPGSTGLIKSPNYPSNYPKNIECKYRVNSGSSSNWISLYFLAFNVEPNTQCRFDYLEVFNGPTTTTGSIGKYCGSTSPNIITQITSDMSMKFKTDGSITHSGFNVRYSISGLNLGGAPGSTGLIKSPNFPSNYPKNIECKYRVNSGVTSNSIAFLFLAFNLEPNPQCRYDYLQVFNGPTTTSRLIGKYCGVTYPNSITQTTSDMSMKFKTDGSITHSGFNIRYSI
uniref:CUB domain-containing protein n=1 Tax=Ciona savignyi TaxID=51511 RepID=H2ZK52_CIOSA